MKLPTRMARAGLADQAILTLFIAQTMLAASPASAEDVLVGSGEAVSVTSTDGPVIRTASGLIVTRTGSPRATDPTAGRAGGLAVDRATGSESEYEPVIRFKARSAIVVLVGWLLMRELRDPSVFPA